MRKLLLLFFFIPVLANAQDAVFSKYNSMPLDLNPAFAGTNGRGRLSMGYRDQWPAIDRGYRTTMLSYDHFIDKINSGVGIKYSNDGGPELLTKTNCIYGVYAYRISLLNDKMIIQPALEFGLINEKIDTSKIITTSPEPFLKTSVGAFDCGAGILVVMERFDVGFTVHHLNQPDLSFIGTSKLPMRITLHGSVILGSTSKEFEKKISVIPQFMVTSQGDLQQLNAGISVKYAHWQIGGAFRTGAVIGMLAYQNSHFRVSYSYDYTVSAIGNSNTGGSHEFNLQLFMFTKYADTLGYSDATTYAF
jgi:type IX secretion system PorP/SprF family membrane protein